MIRRAVIDTNVLVSALLSSKDDTATVQLVCKVIGGEIIPVYSNVITKEYKEVLSRKKFGFSGNTIEYLLSAVEKYGILVDPSPSGIILPDKKDLPFYEVVLEKREDNTYLVSKFFRFLNHQEDTWKGFSLLSLWGTQTDNILIIRLISSKYSPAKLSASPTEPRKKSE